MKIQARKYLSVQQKANGNGIFYILNKSKVA